MSDSFLTDTYSLGTRYTGNLVFSNLNTWTKFIIFSYVFTYIMFLWYDWDAMDVSGGWSDLRDFVGNVQYYAFYRISLLILFYLAAVWGLNKYGFTVRALSGLLFVWIIAALINLFIQIVNWDNAASGSFSEATYNFVDSTTSDLTQWREFFNPQSIAVFFLAICTVLLTRK